jgi:hypothetical protein
VTSERVRVKNMINLTRKAAGRFHLSYKELPEQEGDLWRVDILMLGRHPVLLIVHEYTLYTLVRKKSEYRSLKQIAVEIRKCCPWYRYGGELTIGRNNNRIVNGSVNEMKFIASGQFTIDEIPHLQMTINRCQFSNLSAEKYSYGRPEEAVMQYINGLWPPAQNKW